MHRTIQSSTITSDAIKAFMKAQSELEPAIKDQRNDFLKNSYASLNAIQQQIIPIFTANGFAFIQALGRNEHGDFLETTLLHESGITFAESKCYLHFKKGDMQSYGGAVTYARRYSYISMTGIPTVDDDGNRAVGYSKMRNKQSRKENTFSSQEEKLVQRAERLQELLPTATKDQILQWGVDVTKVIEGIKPFNTEMAEEVSNLYADREAEVGL